MALLDSLEWPAYPPLTGSTHTTAGALGRLRRRFQLIRAPDDPDRDQNASTGLKSPRIFPFGNMCVFPSRSQKKLLSCEGAFFRPAQVVSDVNWQGALFWLTEFQ